MLAMIFNNNLLYFIIIFIGFLLLFLFYIKNISKIVFHIKPTENKLLTLSKFLHRYYNLFFIILFIISLLSFSIIYFHHTNNIEKRFDKALKSYEQSLLNIFNNLSMETNNYTNESIVPNTSSSCTRDRISINNNNIMNMSEGDGFDELEKSFEIGFDLLKASLSEIMKNSNDVLTFWFAFLSIIMVVFTFAGILINNNVLEQSKTQLKFVEKEAEQSIKNIKEESKIETKKLIDENNKNIQISNLLNLGIQATNSQDYKLAEKYFSDIINLDNKNENAYYNRATSKYKLTMYKEAIKDYNKSIKLNPNKAEYYFGKGTSYLKLGFYKKALENYDEAIELNPNYSEVYNNRGLTKHNLGQYKEAIENYDEAIELNPNNPEAYNNRGNSKQSQGQYKEAIEDYNKAIELNTNLSEAYNNRGNAKNNLGNIEEAIEDYNKAIKLNPNYSEAYYNRGNAKNSLYNVYKNINYLEEAIEDYNEAIKLNPNYSEAYYNRGISKSLLLEKIVDKNSEEYKKSFDNAYNDLDTAYNLANDKLKETIKNQVIDTAKSGNEVAKKFCDDKDWEIKI